MRASVVRPLAVILTAASVFMGGNARANDPVRCDGKLMGIGQSRLEVLRYCGEPQDRISFLDQRTTHTRLSVLQQGTTQFTRSTGSYTETSHDVVTQSTPTGDKGHGDERGGTVTLPQTHQHDVTRVTQNNTETITGSYLTLSTFWECKKTSVYVDEYVYNFGAGKFLTFISFENGRVKGIRYGEYGF